MNKLYQIQRRSDGLFAGKNKYPAHISRWSKNGRTFTSLAFVKSHLRGVDSYKHIQDFYMDTPIDDVDIIEWTLGKEGHQAIPLTTALKEMGILSNE